MSTLKTGKVKTTTIADELDTESTAVTNVINGSAKAWVNFNGTGTLSVRDSHNVSSITDHATGDYSINFTNNMANGNYSAVGGASHNSDNNGYVQCMGIKTFAVGSARMITAYIPETGGSHYDSYWATLTVFGD